QIIFNNDVAAATLRLNGATPLPTATPTKKAFFWSLMKFTINTEDKCEAYAHENFHGDAFAFDSRNRFILLGGNGRTGLVHLDQLDKVVCSIDLKSPFKWHVTNYEWDLFNSNECERYLQTRNKIIEIVDVKYLESIQVLEGHARNINQAKWAPLKRNVIASTSSDSFIMLWDAGRSAKPEIKIKSIGEVDCLSWSKSKENVLASTFNNDIKIYDIRMTNKAKKYLKNAHCKKIFSLDWCSVPGEEILLSSSKDKNIKLWNLNMLNERLMEKLIEEFPCWKAKFTPLSLCFGVIPTCQSNFMNTNFMQNNINHHLHKEETVKNETFLMTCQITALNEAKINRIVSNQFDMIVDFDFHVNDDLMDVITWSRDQNIRVFNVNLQKFKSESDKNFKIKNEDELGLHSLNKQHLSALHHTTNTTNSSRKSSFSENFNGTSPNNFTFNVVSQYMNNDRDSSFNLAETAIFSNDFTRPNSQNLIKSQSSTILPHEFLKKYPKCFGAKFSGLPENFIFFTNEGISTSTKSKESEYGLSSSLKRNRGQGNNPGKTKITSSKSFLKRIITKVVIFEIANSLTIRRDLAEKYEIKSDNLEKLCNQNIQIAAQAGRYDIIKIWELFKFVTYTGNLSDEATSLEFGLPWPCSTFGRTLINNIIDNYVEMNDVQSAAMIISKLKLYDLNMGLIKLNNQPRDSVESQEKSKKCSISSSFDENNDRTSSIFENSELSDIDIHEKLWTNNKNIGLLDPNRTKNFDLLLNTYCNLLHKWGLFNKRIEMMEFLNDKPQNMDKKFECFKRCTKCSTQFTGSKCSSCNSSLKCSLCELPVNGLVLYCSACGCGGHYDHLIEWFERHDDCPSACGCRCVDYI
ncbi:WD repeat-containing 59, partial [Brachionus plicatilis]